MKGRGLFGVVAVLLLVLVTAAGSASAATWSSPLTLSDPTQSRAEPGGIVMDASGRSYVLTYQRFANSHGFGVRESVISPTGQLLESQFISNGKQGVADGDQLASPVAVDGGGAALFGWTAEPTNLPRRAQVRFRSPDGTLGPLITASPTSDDAQLRGVGLASDGTGLILALDATTNTLVLRSISSTGALGPVETVTTGVSFELLRNATLHEYPDGTALIAWTRQPSSGDRAPVQARFRRADGAWGATRTLSSQSIDTTHSVFLPDPIIAADEADHALITWSGYDGTSDRVRARRISWSGVGPIVNLSDAGENAYPTSAALADDGDAVLSWIVDRSTTTGINQLVSQWLLADNTRGSHVVVNQTAGVIVTALLSADTALVAVDGGGPGATFAREFGTNGVLGVKEPLVAPKGWPIPPLLIAAAPTGASALTYAFSGGTDTDEQQVGAVVRQPG